MNSISLTSMFLAKGAATYHKVYCKACDAFDGELAFLDHVATFAPKVEGAYQAIKKSREFDVWMYDVVEKFGAFLAEEVGTMDNVGAAELVRLVKEAAGDELSPSEQLAVLRGWNGERPKFPFNE